MSGLDRGFRTAFRCRTAVGPAPGANMPEQNLEQSIFLQAIGLAAPADRAAYLDEACQDNPHLRAELNALLAAHDRLGGAEETVAPERSEVSTDGAANSERQQSTSTDEIPLDFLSPS